MVKIKFSPVVPYPDKQGIWIRLLFKDNLVHQGHILLFVGEDVVDMSIGQNSRPEVILEGDRRAQTDGYLVTYSRLDAVDITKERPEDNGKAINL